MNTLFTASNVNPIDSSLPENGFLRLVPKSSLPTAPFRDPANFSSTKKTMCWVVTRSSEWMVRALLNKNKRQKG
jgi:hypothetical protein